VIAGERTPAHSRWALKDAFLEHVIDFKMTDGLDEHFQWFQRRIRRMWRIDRRTVPLATPMEPPIAALMEPGGRTTTAQAYATMSLSRHVRRRPRERPTLSGFGSLAAASDRPRPLLDRSRRRRCFIFDVRFEPWSIRLAVHDEIERIVGKPIDRALGEQGVVVPRIRNVERAGAPAVSGACSSATLAGLRAHPYPACAPLRDVGVRQGEEATTIGCRTEVRDVLDDPPEPVR
jgi:hypothetical protein